MKSRVAASLVLAAHFVACAWAQVSTKPGMGAVPYAGGVTFRVWAPNATAVKVAGTFNAFSATANPLFSEGASGNWSVDVPGAVDGQQYKYVVTGPAGTIWKKDPRGREVVNSSGNSIIKADNFDWSVYGPTVTLFSDGFETGTFGASWARLRAGESL